MKRAAALACLPFVAFIATASFAEDKPLFVYVSPNPISVNDFLKLGACPDSLSSATAP